MPNWAYCNLCVAGNAEDIAVLREMVRNKDGNFDLSLLRPMPAVLVGTPSPTPTDDQLLHILDLHERGVISYERLVELRTKTYKDLELVNKALDETGYPNWYDWCISNWGTKWPPTDVMLNVDEELALEFSFNSAWSPPGNLIQYASGLFPLLTFVLRYSEESHAYVGCSIYVENRCAAEEVYSFDRRGLPDEFVERYSALLVESDDWERDVELFADLESDVLDYAERLAREELDIAVEEGRFDVV
jgi:hypothetical protein